MSCQNLQLPAKKAQARVRGPRLGEDGRETTEGDLRGDLRLCARLRASGGSARGQARDLPALCLDRVLHGPGLNLQGSPHGLSRAALTARVIARLGSRTRVCSSRMRLRATDEWLQPSALFGLVRL